MRIVLFLLNLHSFITFLERLQTIRSILLAELFSCAHLITQIPRWETPPRTVIKRASIRIKSQPSLIRYYAKLTRHLFIYRLKYLQLVHTCTLTRAHLVACTHNSSSLPAHHLRAVSEDCFRCNSLAYNYSYSSHSHTTVCLCVIWVVITSLRLYV